MENLDGKCVVLGVTGGIAAYKMANVASALRKAGADVHVIMTENATQFITPLTFETLTNNRCVVDTFARDFKYEVTHISLAKTADLIMIAPATANVIAKMAHGIADDMLTTVVLAAKCKKLVAPAMNTAMLENPITQDNLATLKKYGFGIIEPSVGMLACKDVGKGKLPDPEVLLDYIAMELAREKTLAGVRVTVTAGPTQESLDPVRYLTNHSSGRMGYAIAREAMLRGAQVTLISGPVALPPVPGVALRPVTTAKDMLEAVQETLPETDILIKAAAVADYRPVTVADQKIKKKDSDMSIPLERTDDILGWVEKNRHPGSVCVRLLDGNREHGGKLACKAGEEASGHDRGKQFEDRGCRLRCGDECGDADHEGRHQGASADGKRRSGWLPAGRDCGTAVILSESGIFFRFLVDAGKMNAL